VRFREIFRLRARVIAFEAHPRGFYAAFLFLVVGWGFLATANGGEAVKANAPQEVARWMVLFGGLFGLLVSAGLFADAGDPRHWRRHGCAPLHTRISKLEYLGGRFLAA
jgi:hypothetical protein